MDQLDEVSGLSFQKRERKSQNPSPFQFQARRGGSARQARPMSFEPDNTSIQTTSTIKTPAILSRLPDMPVGIPVHEFYKHLPPNLDQQTQMRYLFYWFAQHESKVDVQMGSNRNPVTEKVKRILMERLATDPSIIPHYRTDDTFRDDKNDSSTNMKWKKKCDAIESDIKDLNNELNGWQSCLNESMENHAVAMDRVAEARQNNFKVKEDVDFVNHIDQESRQFIEDHMKEKEMDDLDNVIPNIDADVTEFRQRLNTVNQFQIEAGSLLGSYKKVLSHNATERARIIPDHPAERVLGPSEDTPENRMRNEMENLHALLKVYTKQSSTENNNNDMDIDE